MGSDLLQSSPIVVIGSQRSGTTLVSEVLEALGVFMGARQNVQHEPHFFIDLNVRLLSARDARWDDPGRFSDLLDDPALRGEWRDRLAAIVQGPRIAGFTGWRNYLRGHSLGNHLAPWGWKDPRTTFTLPLWLELFPDARVLHMLRHGIDVAQSNRVGSNKLLAARAEARPTRVGQELKRVRSEVALLRQRPLWRMYGPASSANLASFDSIETGFSLWEKYVREARGHLARLGENALEIRYESLLAKPRETIAELGRFTGGSPSTEVVAIAERINSQRAFAYRDDPLLVAEAERLAPRLRAYGYEPF